MNIDIFKQNITQQIEAFSCSIAKVSIITANDILVPIVVSIEMILLLLLERQR